jgi:hypothetical protein
VRIEAQELFNLIKVHPDREIARERFQHRTLNCNEIVMIEESERFKSNLKEDRTPCLATG